jgi:integrase
LGELTATKVKNAKPKDGKKVMLGDGNGLWLLVDKNRNKSWLFRYTAPDANDAGKRPVREMGLGSADVVDLDDAREKARDARRLLADGKDPIKVKRDAAEAAKVEAARSMTFAAYAARFIAERETGWKNPVHRQQWRNSFRDHVTPRIGSMAIADIDTQAVLSVLKPIWQTTPETARRVRGRIETVLSAARAEGLRTGENPAAWRGHLDQLLTARKKSDVVHHAALPHAEMPGFWRSLATDTSLAARLLRFIILTAARYSEAADMTPGEVQGDIWTVPGARMKADRPHSVPLTSDALACLPLVRVSDVALASCIRRHTATPATIHGFRSSFRDWAGDETHFPREVAEAALAHHVGDDAERAYRRGSALAKRRELMTAWAQFLRG